MRAANKTKNNEGLFQSYQSWSQDFFATLQNESCKKRLVHLILFFRGIWLCGKQQPNLQGFFLLLCDLMGHLILDAVLLWMIIDFGLPYLCGLCQTLQLCSLQWALSRVCIVIDVVQCSSMTLKITVFLT